MMRLIDADKLIEYIDLGHLRPPTEVCFSTFDVCEMIEQAPTVEAWTKAEHNADAFRAYVEGKKSATKRGKWQGIGRTAVTCSLCGAWTETAGNYCPNCGAKMEGGEDVVSTGKGK